jgi:hypothetical protein
VCDLYDTEAGKRLIECHFPVTLLATLEAGLRHHPRFIG